MWYSYTLKEFVAIFGRLSKILNFSFIAQKRSFSEPPSIGNLQRKNMYVLGIHVKVTYKPSIYRGKDIVSS